MGGAGFCCWANAKGIKERTARREHHIHFMTHPQSVRHLTVVLAFVELSLSSWTNAIPRANHGNFHKKMRVSRGGQEKYERKNSERTKCVNAISWGDLAGSPQDFVLSEIDALGGCRPSSFFLTINDLRLRCGILW